MTEENSLKRENRLINLYSNLRKNSPLLSLFGYLERERDSKNSKISLKVWWQKNQKQVKLPLPVRVCVVPLFTLPFSLIIIFLILRTPITSTRTREPKNFFVRSELFLPLSASRLFSLINPLYCSTPFQNPNSIPPESSRRML